jgi:hypothetical protein
MLFVPHTCDVLEVSTPYLTLIHQVKCGRRVSLTTSSPSIADCVEKVGASMSRNPMGLASTACYRESSKFLRPRGG